jgi:hypothetical protein
MLPELEPWQFRLAPDLPTGTDVAGLRLETGPGLPVARMSDATGAPVGLLLGFPLDLKGRQAGGESGWRVPATLGTDTEAFVDAAYETLGGTFLWLFEGNGAARIYLDALGQLPCVWNESLRMAGTTATALYDEAGYAERFEAARYDRLGVRKEGWFPAGLTAHRGLQRLLPNHYLDLHSWQARRHWPNRPIETVPDPAEAVAEIRSLVAHQLGTMADDPDRRLALALTAGRETRAQLAVARPLIGRFDLVTVVGSDRHRTDSVIAGRIARDLGLPHLRLERVTATPAQQERFIHRGGHAVGDTNALYHPSVWPIAQSHVFAGGIGGEVARGFFWKESDRAEHGITTPQLLNRLGLPRDEAVLAALERWMAGVPNGGLLQLLDLAYLENRMAPWSGAQFCCDPMLLRQAPLVNRPAVRLMLSLPPDWKLAARLGTEMIAQAWPELLRYPFNSLDPVRDGFAKLQRVAADPAILMKKLRKLRR